MHYKFPQTFFVTATDTEIGKTFVSAMLALGLNGGYWKPIRTGLPYSDTDWVRDHTGLSDDRLFPESYLFAPHISPHEAARQEGVVIDLAKIHLPRFEPLPHLVVEGAGGILVPINDTQTVLDLIIHLKLPALIVARSSLGTINHTTLTIDKLRQKGVPILGVIMNGPKHIENRRDIEHYGQVPVLAEIEHMQEVNPTSLKAAFIKHFGSEHDSSNHSEGQSNLASLHSS